MRGAHCRNAVLFAAAVGGLGASLPAQAQTPAEITFNYADVRIRYDAASGQLVIEDHDGTSLRSSLRDGGGVALDQANIPLGANFDLRLGGPLVNPPGSEDISFAATLAGSDLDLGFDAFAGNFTNGSAAPDLDGITFANGVLLIRGSLSGAAGGSMLVEPAGAVDWVFRGNDDAPVGAGLDSVAAQYTVESAIRGQFKTGSSLFVDIIVSSFADGSSTAGITSADAFFQQAALRGGFESTGGDLQLSIVRSEDVCDCPADTTPPTIECPENVTLECGDDTSPDSTGYATASDNCDPDVEVTYEDEEDGDCPVIITRIWRAVDRCGNVATCDQIISIDDTQAPVITIPDDVTIECDESSEPDNTGHASAEDSCDPDVEISFEDHSTGVCPVVVTRSWTAIDSCGNVSNGEQVITIRDTSPPTLECPPDVELTCFDSTDPSETGEPFVEDNCDENVTVTYTDEVADGCPKVITRTWTATDACENVSSCEQVITVHDEEPPVIECPPDVTLQCGDPLGDYEATAWDNCDPDVEITYTDQSWGTCPTVIKRTWIARDDCGNVTTCVQRITLGADNRKPVITCPPNVKIECDESSHPNNTGWASATDNCDTSVEITYSDKKSGCCPTVIKRTWTAKDDCGNKATCQQTITIADTKKPVLTCPPDISIKKNGSTNPCVTGFATATDNCDSHVKVTYSDEYSSNGKGKGKNCKKGKCCNGCKDCKDDQKVIKRTWKARDNCGNTATCVQTITVGEPKRDEGCATSYWKSKTKSWPGKYKTSSDFDSVFCVNAYHPNRSLLEVLKSSGSGRDALARQGVAALLNAAHSDVRFPLSVNDVIELVHNALKTGKNIDGVRAYLEGLNNEFCPL